MYHQNVVMYLFAPRRETSSLSQAPDELQTHANTDIHTRKHTNRNANTNAHKHTRTQTHTNRRFAFLEHFLLHGPSGSGKTTLISTVFSATRTYCCLPPWGGGCPTTFPVSIPGQLPRAEGPAGPPFPGGGARPVPVPAGRERLRGRAGAGQVPGQCWVRHWRCPPCPEPRRHERRAAAAVPSPASSPRAGHGGPRRGSAGRAGVAVPGGTERG